MWVLINTAASPFFPFELIFDGFIPNASTYKAINVYSQVKSANILTESQLPTYALFRTSATPPATIIIKAIGWSVVEKIGPLRAFQVITAAPPPLILPVSADPAPVRVVTPGFSELTGTDDAKAAFGVWYAPDDPRNLKSLVPEGILPKLGHAEVVAALHAVQSAPVNAPLFIAGKNSAVATAMNTHLRNWEDNGWIGVPDPAPLQALAAFPPLAPERDIVLCPRTAVSENMAIPVNLLVPAEARIYGAKLSKMTQRNAYLKIRSLQKTPSRKTTAITVALVQEFEKSRVGHAPTPEVIWQSIRHKDITSQIKSWLWKSMHGAHRVGRYWSHIPGFEERGTCISCDMPESLQHILFECPRPGQAQIWDLVGELWRRKSGTLFPTPSLGMVLGSALTMFEHESKMKPSSLNRFYRILISESAYLVWKLRNECVINRNGVPPSCFEVHNR
ncbi:hypothetical protein B0H17DRAFT_1194011 [Mycena rosella]|uniref:Reverse transcriptase zinc-binding domain-containing protein n=1 Tax=Mycena rosella TaxID=1033263 RepID=A0AAD7GS67_MYCRO|nr:hypothetical protein B0H17DRAFT_1194011 [Mycena rosella]